MTDYVDYGEDGTVSVKDDSSCEDVIDAILEHVEARFDILDKQGKDDEILALCQEFLEWGTANTGDEIGYFALKYHEFI